MFSAIAASSNKVLYLTAIPLCSIAKVSLVVCQREKMKKIDYKKELKHLYKPSPKFVEMIEAPETNILMIDGQGDPKTSKKYSEAIETLYSVSYALKFMVKKSGLGIDYGVMPLEGLWWVDDMSRRT